MRRVKINQPSTLQSHHKMHGIMGIADMDTPESSVRVYFTQGKIHSMEIEKTALYIIKISSAEG